MLRIHSRLALPLVFGNTLQEFYNTIDAFVVGRFAGQAEFAAIGVAGTVMNLFLFALVGCCAGFSVLFARAYGKEDMPDLRWIFLSLPAAFFYNFFASLLRASGIGWICANVFWGGIKIKRKR